MSSSASADRNSQQGLTLARKGDCVKAVPFLEDAELARHTPTTGVALADCYVALGELIKASELFHAIADEPKNRRWVRSDYNAQKRAETRAEEVDARIPTLAFEPIDDYPELAIYLDGRLVSDPTTPKQVPADLSLDIEAKATGRVTFEDKIVLSEKERRVITLRLLPKKPKPVVPERPPNPETWLGARFRGIIIPRWLMNAFGEGGTTVFLPGGGITLTKGTGDPDYVFSLGYASYSMGPTPFKPNGNPDTDYEIIESDLQALFATVEMMWSAPLDDDGDVTFRIGGGIGFGWAFSGDLYRTQAYPPKGAGGDPYLYKKCRGPNDPEGSYRYCNQLDKDADHYAGYAEPNWFDGGSRPSLFPWLSIPQVGLAWRLSPSFVIDLEAAATLTGIVTGVGWRVGL